MPIDADVAGRRFVWRGIALSEIEPLIDGEVPAHGRVQVEGDTLVWHLETAVARLRIEPGSMPRLNFSLEGLPRGLEIDSLGLRLKFQGARSYLRNGYQSWDGSFFVEPGTSGGNGPPAKAPTLGFAMTAFLPAKGDGALWRYRRAPLA